MIAVPVAGAPESPAELQAAAALAGRNGSNGGAVVGDGVARARAARAHGAVAATQLAAMARVTEAGAEGWRAYLQVAVPFAASRLGKARSDAEALLPLPGGLELYADLSLRLGAALLSLGRGEEAEDALALSLALDPLREVSLVEFSPDIVEAVERARRRQVPLVPLTISLPELTGASVEVDGRAVGAARATAASGAAVLGALRPAREGELAGVLADVPLSLTSNAPPTGAPSSRSAGGTTLQLRVPRGQHVVVVRRRGYEDAAQAVRVPTEGAEVTLSLVVDRGAAALAAPLAGMSEEQATSLLESVLTFAEADEVWWLAASSRRGAPALLAQRCGAGLRCTAVVEIGYARPGLPAALREAQAALGRGELRYPPSLPGDSRVLPSRTPGGEDQCRLCRSPWLWAGVGVGVAVASAVLLFALGQEQPPPVLVVDPGDF